MPVWLSGAVQAVGSAIGIALQWITGYSKPDVSEARQENDDQKQVDEFNKQQAKGDIESIRKDLSDDTPAR